LRVFKLWGEIAKVIKIKTEIFRKIKIDF
jgi:hypothetical protein